MRVMIVAVIVCAVMAWSSCGSVATQDAVGTNTAVVQTVRTRSADETDWRAAVVGGALRYEDRIATGPDSRLDVELRDRSVLTVGANAALTVDQFVIDDTPDPLGTVFAVARGAFRFVSGSQGASRERVSFRTPTAAIGIRGTIIEGVVGPEALEVLANEVGAFDLTGDPDNAAIIVLVEGEIELEVNGRRVVIREPGQAVAISGRRLSEPFVLPPRAGERFGARLPPRPGAPGDGAANPGPGPQPSPPGQPQGPPGQPQPGPAGQPQSGPAGLAPSGSASQAQPGAVNPPQPGLVGQPQPGPIRQPQPGLARPPQSGPIRQRQPGPAGQSPAAPRAGETGNGPR